MTAAQSLPPAPEDAALVALEEELVVLDEDELDDVVALLAEPVVEVPPAPLDGPPPVASAEVQPAKPRTAAGTTRARSERRRGVITAGEGITSDHVRRTSARGEWVRGAGGFATPSRTVVPTIR